MAARKDLHTLNVGNVSVFRHPGYGETTYDISLASEDIVTWISNWRVAEDYTASNHQTILFRINPSSALRYETQRPSCVYELNFHRLDREAFNESIASIVSEISPGAKTCLPNL